MILVIEYLQAAGAMALYALGAAVWSFLIVMCILEGWRRLSPRFRSFFLKRIQ